MELTWFGGNPGMIRNDDPMRKLHLLQNGQHKTFCGLSTNLRPVTTREANRSGYEFWCESCFNLSQKGL